MKFIKEIDSFEPKDIFECGQCFRWNKETDGSYTGVIRNNVLNVKEEDNNIIIKKSLLNEINGNWNDRLNSFYETVKIFNKINN